MNSLSDEILIHIFAQGTAEEISLWQRVSGHWNNLINDDFVWKKAFLNFWDQKIPVLRICNASWKNEYIKRMREINKMSNQKATAIKIKIGKSKIQDISITWSNSYSSIDYPQTFRLLDKNGLTIAQIKSQKMELEQKRILYFDRIFGDDSSVIYSRFLKGYEKDEDSKNYCNVVKLVLGLSSGEVILYDKCPSKTLLENYTKIKSLTKSTIYKIYKIIPENLLIVYKSQNLDCYEFVNWNFTNTSKSNSTEFKPKLNGHLIIPNIFRYYVLSRSKKIVYINKRREIFIVNLENDENNENNLEKEKLIMKISKGMENSKIIIKEIKSSDWLAIFYGERKISVINHLTEQLVSSFTLKTCKEIISVYCDEKMTMNAENENENENELENYKTNSFDFFVYGFLDDLNSKKGIFYIRIDLKDQKLIYEQQITYFPKEAGILNFVDLWTNSIFTIILTHSGVVIFDSLSLRCINRRSFPKYFTQDISEDNYEAEDIEFEVDSNSSTKMSRIIRLDDSDKFLIYWGMNMVQIWNFSLNFSLNFIKSPKQVNSSADKGLQGKKAIRKYSKYALNHSKFEWENERKEEDRLDSLREHLNIEGLTEEEMISFAQLISKQQTSPTSQTRHVDTEFENEPEIDEDSDFQLALQLSLIDM